MYSLVVLTQRIRYDGRLRSHQHQEYFCRGRGRVNIVGSYLIRLEDNNGEEKQRKEEVGRPQDAEDR